MTNTPSDLSQHLVNRYTEAIGKARLVVSQISRLSGGRNNRAYLIHVGQQRFVMKHYYQHTETTHSRFHAEYQFLNYCHKTNIKCVPEPLVHNTALNVALYTYIEGAPLDIDTINQSHINQCISFILALNQQGYLAKSLSNAAESCSGYHDHLIAVDIRLNRFFSTIKEASNPLPLTKAIYAWITDEILPYWSKMKHAFVENHAITKLPTLTCLSPSDFGFHNALCDANGQIHFIDFEYAGWDDPTKMVCDFFCQPDIPIESCYWESTLAALQPLDNNLVKKVQWWLPVYRLKWVLIMLNEFFKGSAERRHFARSNTPNTDDQQRLEQQWLKARRYFTRHCRHYERNITTSR